jgi:FAD:protein FMN transferase
VRFSEAPRSSRALPFRRKPVWHHSSLEPVLGTRFTLQVLSTKPRVAQAIALQLESEIERLENIFSVYRPTSNLSRWKHASLGSNDSTLKTQEHPELCEVLALAEHWRQQTGGCFTPLADEFTKCWRDAEANQLVPTPGELEALCNATTEPRYVVDAKTGDVTKTGDCSLLSLHAIAKGWIVDRAAELAVRNEQVAAVLVNIGGDLRLCGNGALATSVVAIENPLRAYDNELPISQIRLSSGGLCTSGGSRRGFRIAGRWYSHVIDPRTGYPVDSIASASVLAPDASTADVVATMLSVVTPAEGLAFVESLASQGTTAEQSLGCLIVDNVGRLFSNQAWDVASA